MRKSTIIGALLVGGIALAGCTPAERDSNQPPVPGNPPANAPQRVADPAETNSASQGPAAELLTNRTQLLQLAELATRNSQNPQVQQLGNDLKSAVQPQIDALRTVAGDAPQAPQSTLSGATGPAFDQQFKQQATDLVNTAATLAQQAQSDPQLKDLATELAQEKQNFSQRLGTIA